MSVSLEPCPAASLCASDPDACQSHLTPTDVTGLSILIFLPLLSVLPSASAGLVVWRSGDPYDKFGVPSGLAAVLGMFALGLIPVYLMLTSAERPCDGPLAGCGAISCVCGNYSFEGYVWMNVVLFGLTAAFVREAAPLPWRSRLAMTFGSVAVLLTAVYPEHYPRGAHNPFTLILGVGLDLHLLGLGLFMVLNVAVPYVRLLARARSVVATRHGRSLAVRTLHFVTLLACAPPAPANSPPLADARSPLPVVCLLGGSRPPPHPSLRYGTDAVPYFVLREVAPDDISDYCAPNTPALHGGSHAAAAAACDAWPTLPPKKCAALEVLQREHVGTEAMPSQATYTCEFVNASLTEQQALLFPEGYDAAHAGRCAKRACRLRDHAASVALEWGMLFLVSTYATLYTKVDLLWMGARGGPEDMEAPLVAGVN